MQGDTGQCNDKGKDTFRESELRFLQVLVPISVPLFVFLENSVIYAVMRVHLEPDVSGVIVSTMSTERWTRTCNRKATKSMTDVIRLILRTFSSSCAGVSTRSDPCRDW